ncbi:hypothetical protein BS78_05G068300 [Paspalum vaginatum]|nr:hypothetical protein BS78_05G068300 [Paspalum vaginatum]
MKKMNMSGVPTLLVACLLFILLLSEAPGTAAETVKVITTPIFPQIPRGQTSKDFQVLLRVQAPPAAAGHKGRVPIDLAVALNVGAGAGTERLASVKKAVKFIVRQLHDDDRLAIVAPSNNRQANGFLDIRDARRNAEKLVDELESRGVHAGYASGSGSGLEEAIEMLEELPPAMESSRAGFVIFVSDTAEDSSRLSTLLRGLQRKHPVVVHTFGLGATHDPMALLQIAKESHGTYSFVDDENVESITRAIAVCLSGLKAVAAVGARVRLEATGGSGVEITKIASGGYKSTITDKTSGEVTVGYLYAGEEKSFIVHLNVPAVPPTSSTSLDGCCDNQQLLTASFVDDHHTAGGDVIIFQAILSVQRPTQEAAAAAAATVQRVPFPVLVNRIVQFGVLEMVDTFVQKEIQPLNSITAQVASALAMELQARWEHFVQVHQFWSGVDLGVLETEISNMVSSLAAAAAGGGGGGGTGSSQSVTAYMLSWMSSYQMQRPTAMGSPNSIAAAFVTLDVQLIMQQVVTIVDGACPECECADGGCVASLPMPVFVPSGLNDGTYRVNAAYPDGAIFLDAINQAVKQMYLAMVQASNLKRCDSSGVDAQQPPARAAS